MRYATMLTMAERATGLVRPDAERAVEAALRTLAERISRGEAEDIAAFRRSAQMHGCEHCERPTPRLSLSGE
jgi:uncharacterized protein (DUF2267 family)